MHPSQQITTIKLTVEELDRLIEILDVRFHRDTDIRHLLKRLYCQHPLHPLPFIPDKDDYIFAHSQFK
jgi:hypothetical protein